MAQLSRISSGFGPSALSCHPNQPPGPSSKDSRYDCILCFLGNYASTAIGDRHACQLDGPKSRQQERPARACCVLLDRDSGIAQVGRAATTGLLQIWTPVSQQLV